MLFDLRGRGRRRTVQVIYLSLALLMGGGLVLFGIGSDAGQGGLIDGIAGSGGSASGAIEDRVEQAQERTEANPRDAAAWADLAKERYQLAVSTADPNTGAFDGEAQDQLRQAARAWDRHLALAGTRPDAEAAAVVANLFDQGALNQPARAAQAWNIVLESKPEPTSGDFVRLAQLQYAAGNTREGDLAGRAAVRAAPGSQRRELRTTLDQLKAQALTQSAQGAAGGTAAPATPAPAPAPATP